jgi:hypothetical protein
VRNHLHGIGAGGTSEPPLPLVEAVRRDVLIEDLSHGRRESESLQLFLVADRVFDDVPAVPLVEAALNGFEYLLLAELTLELEVSEPLPASLLFVGDLEDLRGFPQQVAALLSGHPHTVEEAEVTQRAREGLFGKDTDEASGLVPGKTIEKVPEGDAVAGADRRHDHSLGLHQLLDALPGGETVVVAGLLAQYKRAGGPQDCLVELPLLSVCFAVLGHAGSLRATTDSRGAVLRRDEVFEAVGGNRWIQLAVLGEVVGDVSPAGG